MNRRYLTVGDVIAQLQKWIEAKRITLDTLLSTPEWIEFTNLELEREDGETRVILKRTP